MVSLTAPQPGPRATWYGNGRWRRKSPTRVSPGRPVVKAVFPSPSWTRERKRPRDEPEDHALIRRAQGGEELAFEALVERHRARGWRVARGLVEATRTRRTRQEAFLRVFRSLSSFDFAHGFTTWLYRIVTNLAIDHLRKRRSGHLDDGFERRRR